MTDDDTMQLVYYGVLLVVISFFVAVKVKSLLIGQSSDTETRAEIEQFLELQCTPTRNSKELGPPHVHAEFNHSPLVRLDELIVKKPPIERSLVFLVLNKDGGHAQTSKRINQRCVI